MNKYTIVFLAIVISLTGCTPTPEEKFEKAVIKYNKKQDEKSRIYIEESFLTECGAVQVEKAEDYIPGLNSIILKQNGISTVITSDGYKEPWSEELKFSAYDPSSNILTISNGFRADFFSFSRNEEGEQEISRIKSIELTESSESSINSIFVDHEFVYYFYKNKIYRVNRVSSEKDVLFGSKNFSPPYKKASFKAKIIVDSGYMGITIGDGGRYNFTLLQLQSEKVILSTKQVASYFFALDGQQAMFVDGAAGNWVLKGYDFLSGDATIIKKFNNLRDISSSGKKIFYVDSDGLHITDSTLSTSFKKNKLYSIQRLVNNYLLIVYKKKQYLVKTEKYFDAIARYEALIPEFFESDLLTGAEINN